MLQGVKYLFPCAKFLVSAPPTQTKKQIYLNQREREREDWVLALHTLGTVLFMFITIRLYVSPQRENEDCYLALILKCYTLLRPQARLHRFEIEKLTRLESASDDLSKIFIPTYIYISRYVTEQQNKEDEEEISKNENRYDYH